MKLKHLEHQGNEEFSQFTDRREFKKIEKVKEVKEKLDAIKQREADQREWMKTNNPFLWNGDIDEDDF